MITYSSEGVRFPNIMKHETSNWIKKVAEKLIKANILSFSLHVVIE